MSNAVWLADAEEAWVAGEIVGSASDSVTVKVLATMSEIGRSRCAARVDRAQRRRSSGATSSPRASSATRASRT